MRPTRATLRGIVLGFFMITVSTSLLRVFNVKKHSKQTLFLCTKQQALGQAAFCMLHLAATFKAIDKKMTIVFFPVFIFFPVRMRQQSCWCCCSCCYFFMMSYEQILNVTLRITTETKKRIIVNIMWHGSALPAVAGAWANAGERWAARTTRTGTGPIKRSRATCATTKRTSTWGQW